MMAAWPPPSKTEAALRMIGAPMRFQVWAALCGVHQSKATRQKWGGCRSRRFLSVRRAPRTAGRSLLSSKSRHSRSLDATAPHQYRTTACTNAAAAKDVEELSPWPRRQFC
ncbi:hypothetical protein NDU88_006504 [Pleurodeles waltl]|uniref:Uncharacterized protein n=1 Tax=Pleurodeles waltl TaxID=8319 RepID=A0AAV7PM11_PLEWA|nr:hypothetical protein NDU88_006504 [Pleurodeles waltl]